MNNSKISVDGAIKKASNKKRETWSQTKKQGDKSEEIYVEKLDNEGYLVTVSKSWYDSKNNWQHKESKLYSETNPLDDSEDSSPMNKLADFIIGNKQ